jgi:hypothetical protein
MASSARFTHRAAPESYSFQDKRRSATSQCQVERRVFETLSALIPHPSRHELQDLYPTCPAFEIFYWPLLPSRFIGYTVSTLRATGSHAQAANDYSANAAPNRPSKIMLPSTIANSHSIFTAPVPGHEPSDKAKQTRLPI